jgi:adenine deaminase
MKISGKLIDIHERDIYPAEIYFNNGRISSIERIEGDPQNYILPGFIDAHVHIESSMITPGAFAVAAVKHGTVGVISDPHEIANVMGVEGIEFMINDSKKVPLRFWFGAPSCVPATDFETAGSKIGSEEIEKLLRRKDILYLSEMMNFPGVIYDDPEVLKKIRIAKDFNKPIDGHAPGLSGKQLEKYVKAGITTDHECSTIGEAREKIALGMKILIREGSAARNLDALKELIKTNPEMVMLCSDDLHPEMLLSRHINKLVAKLICEGFDIFDVIKVCTENPVKHYGIESGLLSPGQLADFIIVDDYRKMNVLETWIKGVKVFDRGKVLFNYRPGEGINKFNCTALRKEDIVIKSSKARMQVIQAFDGELLTKRILANSGQGKVVNSDTILDFLKIVVKDRYNDTPPAVCFIKGFGLKQGAFASSVAHDSHNIICVGTTDEEIISAINEVVRIKGGLSVSSGGKISSLKLNIAGIMSDSSCEEIASEYQALSAQVRSMGCTLKAPFMTLSFMALLVIPELKIGDHGLFDVTKFCPTNLFVE